MKYYLTQPMLGDDVMLALARVVKSGYFTPGPEVAMFEKEWADYCGCLYGVACNSGTTALHLALVALGGDKEGVACSAFTCIPSACPIVYEWETPLFIDCDGMELNITPNTVAEALAEGFPVKAAIVVHIYGNPVQQSVFDMFRASGIPVIEDACEAHGATVGNRPVGSIGTLGCFSFRGDKMITAGGVGGMVVTNRQDLAEKMRLLRDLGLNRNPATRYDAKVLGYGYQMGELQAAFGRTQIAVLSEVIRARRQVIECYHEEIERERLDVVPMKLSAGGVGWRFMVDLPEYADRAAVMLRLRENGVETLPGFTPLDKVFAGLTGEYAGWPFIGKAPNAAVHGERGLCLPCYPQLTKEDVTQIVRSLNSALDG